jgi:hypothetical protein
MAAKRAIISALGLPSPSPEFLTRYISWLSYIFRFN